jgi:hypothetical protein
VSNPFTSQSRREERDAKIMETHRNDRDARDATRKAAWESSARGDAINRDLKGPGGQAKKSTLADRAKYQFEADSEDDEMENEIDANLDALHGAAKRLGTLGRAMGQEVETQNKHLARIDGKTDKVRSTSVPSPSETYADTSFLGGRPDCHEPREIRPHSLGISLAVSTGALCVVQ